jgi:phosphoglycerate kinase
MPLKSIKQLKNLKNKRVLLRLDFDVPLKNGCIVDDSRLRDALPTLHYLLRQKAKIILIGHLDRPGGKIVKSLSLLPVKNHLEKLLHKKIKLIKIDRYLSHGILRSPKLVQDKVNIFMLENLRFSDREEKNCKKFAKNLASLADIYVNNAFAVSHRAHASTHAIQKYLPTFVGLSVEEEIKILSQVLKKPKHPLVLIIGGAKIETKLPVIQNFIKPADYILLGGEVANVFIKALGYETGKSIVDNGFYRQAEKTLNQLRSRKSEHKLILPIDVKTDRALRKIDLIGKDEIIFDIGPQTIKAYARIIKSARTIVWNGPMGKIEDKRFRVGTLAMVRLLIKSKARVIIGGGDTHKIFKHKKVPVNIFVSSGGGAMLEFLAGKELPGLK